MPYSHKRKGNLLGSGSTFKIESLLVHMKVQSLSIKQSPTFLMWGIVNI